MNPDCIAVMDKDFCLECNELCHHCQSLDNPGFANAASFCCCEKLQAVHFEALHVHALLNGPEPLDQILIGILEDTSFPMNEPGRKVEDPNTLMFPDMSLDPLHVS